MGLGAEAIRLAQTGKRSSPENEGATKMFANAGSSMATLVGHAALNGFAVPSTFAMEFSLAPVGWFLTVVAGLALVIVAIKLDRTREQSASKRAPAPLFGSDEAASVSQVVRPLPLTA